MAASHLEVLYQLNHLVLQIEVDHAILASHLRAGLHLEAHHFVVLAMAEARRAPRRVGNLWVGLEAQLCGRIALVALLRLSVVVTASVDHRRVRGHQPLQWVMANHMPEARENPQQEVLASNRPLVPLLDSHLGEMPRMPATTVGPDMARRVRRKAAQKRGSYLGRPRNLRRSRREHQEAMAAAVIAVPVTPVAVAIVMAVVVAMATAEHQATVAGAMAKAVGSIFLLTRFAELSQ